MKPSQRGQCPQHLRQIQGNVAIRLHSILLFLCLLFLDQRKTYNTQQSTLDQLYAQRPAGIYVCVYSTPSFSTTKTWRSRTPPCCGIRIQKREALVPGWLRSIPSKTFALSLVYLPCYPWHNEVRKKKGTLLNQYSIQGQQLLHPLSATPL